MKCKSYEVKKFDFVRILGTVTKIRRKTSNFTSFVLDDGFGDVIIKVPERVEVNVGDIVEVFGKVREDFVMADKVFQRDIYYEIIRLLELKKIKDILPKEEKVEEKSEEEYKVEKVHSRCSEEDIINFIMELLEEKEIFELHEIYKEFEGNEDKVDRVIEKLKSEGMIFEEVPGRYRRL